MPRKADKKSESSRDSRKQSKSGKLSSSRAKKADTKSKPQKAASAKAQTGKAAKKSASARTSSGARAVVKRVVSTVVGALTRKKTKTAASEAKAKPVATAKARGTRREADIPMDQIASTYTPTQTSLKAGFRVTGADRQRDQEFANGAGDGRWNDEDLLTNKSGDPRIGTHGRTYEPGEKRAAKGADQDE
jgi:hypothetical protein